MVPTSLPLSGRAAQAARASIIVRQINAASKMAAALWIKRDYD
jgi:hypothetical protein